MARFRRDAPLPEIMQGRWVELGEPTSFLVVAGGEIECFGARVAYDYKDIAEVDGMVSVTLGTDDADDIDTFARAHITGLVVTPEGEFHVYNVKFGAQFVRP